VPHRHSRPDTPTYVQTFAISDIQHFPRFGDLHVRRHFWTPVSPT
jgi:hypothetical protein